MLFADAPLLESNFYAFTAPANRIDTPTLRSRPRQRDSRASTGMLRPAASSWRCSNVADLDERIVSRVRPITSIANAARTSPPFSKRRLKNLSRGAHHKSPDATTRPMPESRGYTGDTVELPHWLRQAKKRPIAPQQRQATKRG
jgi:hypothetical protein